MHGSKSGMTQLLPSAYLSVDLFFMLSGFVIAHAYDGRLRTGLGTRRFMLQRLIRLYPLYLIGTLLSVLVIVAGFDPGWTGRGLAQAFAYALAMLPVPPWIDGIEDHYTLYPLNDSAWSLMFELLVNLAFAAGHRWLGLRALVAWVLLAALVLVAATIDGGSVERGWAWSGFAVGAGRFGFSFPLGVLLYRLHAAGRLPKWPVPPIAAVVGLLAVLALPSIDDRIQIWRDLGVLLLLLPPLIVIGAGHEMPRRPSDWLGEISYPLYMLHGPALALLAGLAARYGPPGGEVPLGWRALALAVLALAAAPLARWVDAPLRRWLTRSWVRRTERTAPAP